METKKCTKCKNIKPLDLEYFGWRKDKHIFTSWCKACYADYSRSKYIHKKNLTKICKMCNIESFVDKTNRRQFCDNCRNKRANAAGKRYRKIPENRSKERIRKRKYNKIKTQKRANNPALKLRHNISVSVRNALSRKNSKKQGSILGFLPYTIKDLKKHLEVQFEAWMTWDNWGTYNPETWDDDDPSTWTWQIDHIIPQSKLPYDSMQHTNFYNSWSLNNLRPLSSKENLERRFCAVLA